MQHQSDLDLYRQEGLSDFEQLVFKSPANFHVDVLDKGGYYEMHAEFAGVPKEDIHLDVEGDCMTLHAHHEFAKEENDGRYLRKERHYGKYYRKFDVSNVETSQIKAKYDHGLLTVTLPKKKDFIANAKAIEIE